MLHVKFYKIPCYKSRDTTVTRTLQKTEKQHTEIKIRKCIIVVSNNIYFADKCLCDFIQ